MSPITGMQYWLDVSLEFERNASADSQSRASSALNRSFHAIVSAIVVPFRSFP